MSPQRHRNHLLWRAGFGPSLAEGLSTQETPQATLARLLQPRSAEPITVVDLQAAAAESRRDARAQQIAGNEAALKDFQERQKGQRIALNVDWIHRMVASPDPLREKMALFWHDHFGVRTPITALTQIHINTLRQHALGSFRTLLLAVAQDPAMLQFLNGQQNRKGAPNENFARELLELYTLGRGHYTEADIKAAARAFTGWGFDASGQFVSRPWAHDMGDKTFMGKSGNLNGEDIIARVLEQRRCAEYLTQKIVAHFVSEAPHPELVAELSKAFYESDYHITRLLSDLFRHPAFVDAQAVGTRIKSPVELLVGLMRQLEVRFASNEPILFVQKVLGQMLGFPPSVAGWPTGRQWIDTSSLLIRLKLSENLLRAAAFDVKAKDDGDDGDRTNALMRQATPEQRQALRQLRQVRATANLAALEQLAGSGGTEAQLDRLVSFFLQSDLRPEVRRVVLAQANLPNPLGESLSTRLSIALLSLPDYQLA